MVDEMGIVQRHTHVSWRSIISGFFVSILCFMILMSLGVGVGGFALHELIEGPGSPSGGGWSTGAAIWTIVSMMLSLFAGGYFASRITGLVPARIGAAQGLVIASLFFVAMFYQVFSMVGMAGRATASTVSGAASMVGSATSGLTNLAQQLPVQDVLDRLFANLNIENPQIVAQGVLQRVLAGNFDSAATYFSQQTGITQAEAQQRLQNVQSQLTGALENAGATAATFVSRVGWTFFILTVLGPLAAAWGGGLGSRENRVHPIEAEVSRRVREPSPVGV